MDNKVGKRESWIASQVARLSERDVKRYTGMVNRKKEKEHLNQSGSKKDNLNKSRRYDNAYVFRKPKDSTVAGVRQWQNKKLEKLTCSPQKRSLDKKLDFILKTTRRR